MTYSPIRYVCPSTTQQLKIWSTRTSITKCWGCPSPIIIFLHQACAGAVFQQRHVARDESVHLPVRPDRRHAIDRLAEEAEKRRLPGGNDVTDLARSTICYILQQQFNATANVYDYDSKYSLRRQMSK